MTAREDKEKQAEAVRLPRSFHLEAEPCGEGVILVVSGAKRILSYTPDSISLDLGKGPFAVVGNNLLCRSFFSGTLEIRGRILEIRFCQEIGGEESGEDS